MDALPGGREGPVAPAPLAPAEIRQIFYGIMLAMFLSALDGTIVATAMPTMGRDLGDAQHLPWVVTAYLLASTAVTPLYGKFSDMHGRRLTMLIAIAIFVAGSVACALAPSVAALSFARALQGFGGGGLIALAQTIIGDMVTPRERGRYQVYFGVVFASSSVLGPVLGGLLAGSVGWPWIFWINLPLGALAFGLVNGKLRRLPRHERRHRLDVAGAVLMVGATASLLLAVSWGGSAHPWLSAPILGLLGASALLWLAFGLHLRRTPEPLIPLDVLSDPVVATAALSGALTMGTYVGLTITVPIFFESSLGLTARQSGLALVPFMVGVTLGATVSGRAMASLDRYKRVPAIGLAAASACVGAFAALAGTAGLPALLALLTVASIGLGTVFPVATVSVQNAVQAHHLGTATATMNFMRQLAGAVIVALFGAIAFGGSAAALESFAARGAVPAASFVPVFWLAAVLLACGWSALLLMEERPLRGRAPPRSVE